MWTEEGRVLNPIEYGYTWIKDKVDHKIRAFKRAVKERYFNFRWELISDKEYKSTGYLDPYNGWWVRIYKSKWIFDKAVYKYEWYLPMPKHAMCRCSVVPIQ